MSLLCDDLMQSTLEWRKSGYACSEYPLIGEILGYQIEVLEDSPVLKFLRTPQFLALEVYWYVRLKLKTPHIINLYKHYDENDKKVLLNALSVSI